MLFFKSNWLNWLNKSRFLGQNYNELNISEKWLNNVRDVILSNAKITQTDIVADLGCGTGLLGLEILKSRNNGGCIYFIDKDKKCINECKKQIKKLNINSGFELLNCDCTKLQVENSIFDKVVARSLLCHVQERENAISEIYRTLKNGGIFCCFEPVLSENTRYWQLVNENSITDFEFFKEIENKIWTDKNDSLFNYNSESIISLFNQACFSKVDSKIISSPRNTICNDEYIDFWFLSSPSPNKKNLQERYLEYTTYAKFKKFKDELKQNLRGKLINAKSNFVFIKAIK
jgi:ubiquinone/menaquinone biosynthesis C-methylase UbiE